MRTASGSRRWLVNLVPRVTDARDRRSAELKQQTLAYNVAHDAAGNLAYLAPNKVNLQLTQERWPKLSFHETREHALQRD